MELTAKINELTFLHEEYEIESLVVCKVYISLIENMPAKLPLPFADLLDRSVEALHLIKAKEAADQEMSRMSLGQTRRAPEDSKEEKGEED